MSSELEIQVLIAVAEGYAARAGMKDRIRALNEWEIARRSVRTDLSYAEYLEHPLRDQIMNALSALQRQGFVTVWDRGVKYDSFVPTSDGTQHAARLATPDLVVASVDPPAEPPVATGGSLEVRILERLDEIVRLLQSIDVRLERAGRGNEPEARRFGAGDLR